MFSIPDQKARDSQAAGATPSQLDEDFDAQKEWQNEQDDRIPVTVCIPNAPIVNPTSPLRPLKRTIRSGCAHVLDRTWSYILQQAVHLLSGLVWTCLDLTLVLELLFL